VLSDRLCGLLISPARARRILATGTSLVLILAASAALTSTASASRKVEVQRFTAVSESKGAATFRLGGLDPRRVVGAELRVGSGKRRAIHVRALRAGARHGVLRLRARRTARVHATRSPGARRHTTLIVRSKPSALTAPSSLTATPKSAAVGLNWGASSGRRLAGYNVYRDGQRIASIGAGTTSYTASGLANGTSYSFYVVAYSSSGTLSPLSNTVTATPQASTTPPPSPGDTTAPSQPMSLTAKPGDGTVSLSWAASSDNVGVTGYRVYRNGTQVGSPSGTSYTDTGLTNGTSYSYTVAAVDAAGNRSTPSSPATASPAASPASPGTPGSPGTQPVTCDRFASTSGSDGNAGTSSSPFASPQKLLDSLSAGQTGCLRGGTYNVSELRAGHSGAAGSPITLASYPSERAKIVTQTDVYLPSGTTDVSFRNLDITTTATSTATVMIQDFSDRSSWIGNDISGNGSSHCMELGSVGYGIAHDTMVRSNRFHDCGNAASGNQDHAIYVSQSRGATITDNVFWKTAAYAIHLYPDADGTTVTHNIIDGSGYGGIIFASDQYSSGKTSDNNTVAYNVITNGGRYGMDYYWGPAGQGTGNVAHDNCLYNNAMGDTQGSMSGISVTNDTNANPMYVNPAAHDYRLQSGSPCLAVVGYDTAARLGF
jgi:chitodextrinase